MNDAPKRQGRLPSPRIAALLSAGMLGIGVAVGAAIGPAPTPSYAGSAASEVAQRLPLLLATAAQRRGGAAAAGTSAPSASPAAVEPPAFTQQSTPAPAAGSAAPSTPATAPATSSPEEPASAQPTGTGRSKAPTLPAITNVWLIELSGGGFAEALAQPSAAPYITGQLLPAATLMSGWSAITAGAFASDAALAVPPAAGATPPLLHSIVQPPCPEGAAGAGCAVGTPGALSAADEFLKGTLAQITSTALYREHGLVLVTFASVAVPTQSGLPAGASDATLTYQPPAGVALLSPFVTAGARSTGAFNSTSPSRSLEKLLH